MLAAIKNGEIIALGLPDNVDRSIFESGVDFVDCNTADYIEAKELIFNIDILPDLKSKAKLTLTEFFTAMRKSVVGDVDKFKLAGWADDYERALRIINNKASTEDTAIVQTEATARGKNETAKQLAAKQIAKGNIFSKAKVLINGLENKAFEDIDSITDKALIDATVAGLEDDAQTKLNALLGI